MCTQVHLKPFPLYFQPQEDPMGTSLLSQSTPQVIAPLPPRLLDQVAQAARQCGASEPTTTQLVSWLRTFILLHGKRHPRELGLPDASRFLEQVLRTAKQPLSALESARWTSTSLDVHPGRN
jgi:hypothetical protein